jgi:hypothetical protein
VHHIDLNFGCPVKKVTSRGGGSALPLRPQLFRRLVAAAVAAAGPDVPVTVKLRMGLTPDLLTYIQVGERYGTAVQRPVLLSVRCSSFHFSEWSSSGRSLNRNLCSIRISCVLLPATDTHCLVILPLNGKKSLLTS